MRRVARKLLDVALVVAGHLNSIQHTDVRQRRARSLEASGTLRCRALSSSRHPRTHVLRSDTLETHGPLGTLWVGLGLCAFYIALVWINTLLGFLLTPLFIVPGTWRMDKVKGKAPVRG